MQLRPPFYSYSNKYKFIFTCAIAANLARIECSFCVFSLYTMRMNFIRGIGKELELELGIFFEHLVKLSFFARSELFLSSWSYRITKRLFRDISFISFRHNSRRFFPFVPFFNETSRFFFDEKISRNRWRSRSRLICRSSIISSSPLKFIATEKEGLFRWK